MSNEKEGREKKKVGKVQMAGGLLGQADAGPAAPPMVAPPPRRAVSVRVPASSLVELRCLSGLGRIIKVSAQIVSHTRAFHKALCSTDNRIVSTVCFARLVAAA